MNPVVNQDKIQRILALCKNASGTHSSSGQHIPFEMPCSIDRDTVMPRADTLYVSPKADGVRYLLCLCTDSHGRPIASFVNRSDECYATMVQAPQSWFQLGTVFDGDMCENITNPTRTVYLVFNVLCFRGQSMFDCSYRDRVSCLVRAVPSVFLANEGERKTFGNCVLTSACDEFDIVAKPVRPATELRALFQEKLVYKTDGVVFTPMNDGMISGRNRRMLKWKSDNTVDLRLVVRTDNTYELQTIVKGCFQPLLIAHTFILCNMLQSVVRGFRLFRKLMRLPPIDFEMIVEFLVSPGISPMFTYERLRTDKSTPNDNYTVERTIVAAESGISREQLCFMMENSLTTTYSTLPYYEDE
jgi:hypothetical protein